MKKRNSNYGIFLQEGGMPQEQPQQVDPQQEAEAILQAFQSISPEAQQLVLQTLTQG